MSVTRPPLDVQHQGRFWPWGATRKLYRSDFKLFFAVVASRYLPSIETVGFPPEDAGLPPFIQCSLPGLARAQMGGHLLINKVY